MKRFPHRSPGLRDLSVALLLLSRMVPPALANPQGGTVSQGTASITTKGSQLTIQTSDRAYINWQSFNIGLGESTTFVQPSASSIVWNRINDPNPSQILGTLDANGYVILQNQSGFYVGGQASINAAGLIMTTSPTPPPDLSSAGAFDFNTVPPAASIINYGQLNAGQGGSVFLIASDIENHGSLSAPGGNLGLYAGKQVLVSERPDGRGLSAEVNLPQGSVDNSGKLVADAGTIALNAQVVNQGGLIQANSVREVNGVIELVASDSLTLGASSVISAKGDVQGASPGGNVTIQSGNTFSDAAGSSIDVSGGAAGGNGGQVEISAPAMNAIQSQVEGVAAAGWLGGKLSIDPLNIVLSSSGSSAPPSGTVNYNDPPTTGTLTLNVNSFSGMYQIDLQASQNITVATGWTLADSPNLNASLTLQAGNNITVNTGDFIKAGQNWTLNLFAGVDFSQPGFPVVPGTGSLVMNVNGTQQNGSGTLQTANGNLNVLVGQNVTLGVGAIRTIGGGNVSVTADSGTVSSGVNSSGIELTGLHGYTFGLATGPGYAVDPSLTGIGTAAGGNVTISAGLDVISPLPFFNTALKDKTGGLTEAGSGAFDPTHPGVVTVTAGRNVIGHYVVADSERNGQIVASTITAQTGDAGAAQSSGQPLALSLITGGWDVEAPDGNIHLQEVRNPSGIFNNNNSDPLFYHLFDYDPQSFVDLNAHNAVELIGGGPRPLNFNVPVVYPGTLEISAGAGGITFDSASSITLAPSPYGELKLATTSGGPLTGSGSQSSVDLLMSDSDATRVSTDSTEPTFADHASIPVQFNNPDPVVLNISGSVEGFGLITPKETQITVGGNMDNSYFQGQNLHPGDITSITVDGRLSIANNGTYAKGYLLAGPGQFDITAGSMDLGYSQGIQSIGAGKSVDGTVTASAALARLGGLGATINLDVAGDLTMAFSTIATGDLGNININVNGSINLGGALPDFQNPSGIFTAGPGNINIVANGDIDVAESRVATFNGGNITLESRQGNVSTGNGQQTDLQVELSLVDPVTGNVATLENVFNGSGVLAYTLPLTLQGDTAGQGTLHFSAFDQPGNITITTPRGSISSGDSGIVQEPLNGNESSGPTVTLTAGTHDGSTVIYPGDIDLNGSGVIGGKIVLDASRNIIGLVVGRQDTTVNAVQNFSGTLLSGGAASVSAGGTASGTIIGITSVSVGGGGTVDATILSQNASVNGAQTASLSSTATASSTATGAAAEAGTETKSQTLVTDATATDDDLKKRQAKRPLLARFISRVRVLLPN